MLRRGNSAEIGDDPVVRKTVARLRYSVIAVLIAVGVNIFLAGVGAVIAFNDGHNAALHNLANNGPSNQTWVILFGGFAALGFVLFSIVSRPYDSARSHAVDLVDAYRTLEASTLETFAALNATVEAKDRYTAGHGLRVTLISILIAQEMGMPEKDIDTLRHAATFHDIGKIAVPDDVLRCPGELSDREFEAMKIHPSESARICGKLAVLRDAVPAIRSHHERIDGEGYPDGLKGSEIPLGARIIAVADTWDAITSDRPYRSGQPATVALDEIRRCTGTQFDAEIVEVFERVLAKDPWMFGLTPENVEAYPSAPGRTVESSPQTVRKSDPNADDQAEAA